MLGNTLVLGSEPRAHAGQGALQPPSLRSKMAAHGHLSGYESPEAREVREMYNMKRSGAFGDEPTMMVEMPTTAGSAMLDYTSLEAQSNVMGANVGAAGVPRRSLTPAHQVPTQPIHGHSHGPNMLHLSFPASFGKKLRRRSHDVDERDNPSTSSVGHQQLTSASVGPSPVDLNHSMKVRASVTFKSNVTSVTSGFVEDELPPLTAEVCASLLTASSCSCRPSVARMPSRRT